MSGARDDWNDVVGAAIYAEVVAAGQLYPALAAALADALSPAQRTRVLDLATGTGLVAEALLACGAGSVVGVDAAEAMVATARHVVADPRAAFLTAQPEALPLPAAHCTGATCSAAFWHFPAPTRALAELARVLSPGGGLVFNVPAAQLEDVDDLPPAPLQLALARAGERHFGAAPRPAGPQRARAGLIWAAKEHGFDVTEERTLDVPVPQSELRDLLEVPAIGARLYPHADEEHRAAWIEDAAERVTLDEALPIRWWQCCLRLAGGS